MTPELISAVSAVIIVVFSIWTYFTNKRNNPSELGDKIKTLEMTVEQHSKDIKKIEDNAEAKKSYFEKIIVMESTIKQVKIDVSKLEERFKEEFNEQRKLLNKIINYMVDIRKLYDLKITSKTYIEDDE